MSGQKAGTGGRRKGVGGEEEFLRASSHGHEREGDGAAAAAGEVSTLSAREISPSCAASAAVAAVD